MQWSIRNRLTHSVGEMLEFFMLEQRCCTYGSRCTVNTYCLFPNIGSPQSAPWQTLQFLALNCELQVSPSSTVVGLKILSDKMQEICKSIKPRDSNWHRKLKPLLSPVHLLLLIFLPYSYKWLHNTLKTVVSFIIKRGIAVYSPYSSGWKDMRR